MPIKSSGSGGERTSERESRRRLIEETQRRDRAGEATKTLDPRTPQPSRMSPRRERSWQAIGGFQDSFQAEILKDTPSLYWPMLKTTSFVEETYVLTHGDRGYTPSGVTEGAALIPGDEGSWSFDGVNDKADATGQLFPLDSAKAYSIELLMNWDGDTTAANQYAQMSNGGGGTNAWVWADAVGNWQAITFVQGAARTLNVPAAAIVAGTTYHIVIRMHIYNLFDVWVNGVRQATLSLPESGDGSTTPATFGGLAAVGYNRAGGAEWYDGRLAHLAMYGFALPETRIRRRSDLLTGALVAA